MEELCLPTKDAGPSYFDEQTLRKMYSPLHADASVHLKNLVTLACVADLETSDNEKTIESYEGLAGLADFNAQVYKSLKQWMELKVVKRKEETKWAMLIDEEHTQDTLVVVRPVARRAGAATVRDIAAGSGAKTGRKRSYESIEGH